MTRQVYWALCRALDIANNEELDFCTKLEATYGVDHGRDA
jgi:hypothetical protein